MKLKDILLSIALANNTVEVYYDEANGFCDFGLKINNIDFKVISEDFEDLYSQLENDINSGFGDDLIISGEGNTSYTLLDNFKCIKTAEYFSILTERYEVWSEDNSTTFCFDSSNLPFDTVSLVKEKGVLKVNESKELSKILTKEEYSKFTSFYSDLLIDFQELQGELDVIVDNKRTICELSYIDAWYKKEMDFTLFNSSSNDYSIDEFREILVARFNFTEHMANTTIK